MFSKNCFRIISILIFFNLGSAQAQEPHVTFSLISNDKRTFEGKLLIEHLPRSGIWNLAFTSKDSILSAKNGTLIQPKGGGSFYLIKFLVPDQEHDPISILITGKGAVKKYSDVPAGYFLISEANHAQTDNPPQAEQVFPITSTAVLPPWTEEAREAEKQKILERRNHPTGATIEKPNFEAADLGIVPLPVEIKKTNGVFKLNTHTKLIYPDPATKAVGKYFVNAIKGAIGFTVKAHPKIQNLSQRSNNTISLMYLKKDEFVEDKYEDGYILDVNSSKITVHAHSKKGFFYGLQTLRQLLPPRIFSQKLDKDQWEIQGVHIKDYPRFEYRGLHLDVARHFFQIKYVKRLIDLMAVHKLNYFQWHLTDDEGWRIEIKKYPKLTQIGAWRGFNHPLSPAYGSGPALYGGFYTQSELRDIVNYAEERNVTIVPEIDLPGHARALIVSLPELLLDREDDSQYTSVQGYNDNVLSFCKESTFKVLDDIIEEIATLFKSEYLHVGGDEVPNGAWVKSCAAKKYDAADPLFRTNVQNAFMSRIQSIITSKGKKMAGWEELAEEPKSLLAPLRIHIWNEKQIEKIYKTAAQAGYKIIMGPAENLYFDLAYNPDPKEPGSDWAGYTDTFFAYNFIPVRTEKGQTEDVIQGVQGHLWSELIDSPDKLDYMGFPKIVGLAELSWTSAQQKNWEHFTSRMTRKHLQRLKYYGVQYREEEFGK